MTKHEFLVWAVPFFTITTVFGAAFSIMRLVSKRPYSGTSSIVAFQANGLWRLVEKGSAFVYIIAVLGFVAAICGSLVVWGHQ